MQAGRQSSKRGGGDQLILKQKTEELKYLICKFFCQVVFLGVLFAYVLLKCIHSGGAFQRGAAGLIMSAGWLSFLSVPI